MKLTQPLPPRNHFAILEAFSLLYEDLDLQLVESKLIEFICFTFGFDRTAFFFVKHKKNVLQGKQGCGFEPGVIEDIQVELSSGASLAAPLLSGAPLRSEGGKDEAWKRGLNLTNYVLVPIVNRKHAACWEQRNCAKTDCPVYRNKWMHCWLLPDFVCCERQDTSGERRALSCEMCPVYAEKNLASMEGVLLVDNSLSGEPIPEDTVVTLSIIAHAVGRAINNSKLFNRAVHEAINDFLTGLYNRRYFNNRVEEEINRAERYGEPLCLVF